MRLGKVRRSEFRSPTISSTTWSTTPIASCCRRGCLRRRPRTGATTPSPSATSAAGSASRPRTWASTSFPGFAAHGDPLRRQWQRQRDRHLGHGRRGQRRAQANLRARLRTARQVHGVRGGLPGPSRQTTDRQVQPRRRHRSTTLRHRPERAWDVDPERHRAGPDHAQRRLAARTRDESRHGGRSSTTRRTTRLRWASSSTWPTRIPTSRPTTSCSASNTIRCSPDVLRGGRRVAYGARAVVKGGLQALPKLTVPGAVIVGDDAGFLNMLKIKGTHTAMKSGMLAAESVFDALQRGDANTALDDFRGRVDGSWLGKELRQVRNVGPALHKFGTLFGMAYTFVDQKIARGHMPFTLRDAVPDHARLKPVAKAQPIHYPKPDGVLSFDKLSSVFLSNTNHEEDQPCHLTLADSRIAHPRQPAALRRAGPALLSRRRLRGGRGSRRTTLPDQRPELRALQDLRHQGSGAEHQLGDPRRHGRAELREHVGATAHPSGRVVVARPTLTHPKEARTYPKDARSPESPALPRECGAFSIRARRARRDGTSLSPTGIARARTARRHSTR